MECMNVTSGYDEQDVGVAIGSGWNLWVWLQISSYHLSLLLLYLFFLNVFRSCSSTFSYLNFMY